MGLVLILMCVLGTASDLNAMTIGVYADSTGTSCNLTATSVGQPVTAFIVAQFGEEIEGTTGAHFRVEGLPAGWSTTSTLTNPLALALGNPFAEGADVVFPYCMGSPLVLFRVTMLPTSMVDDVPIAVVSPGPVFCWITRDCPFLLGCEAVPCNFKCVSGVKSWINGSGGCVVGVEATNWSTLKQLY